MNDDQDQDPPPHHSNTVITASTKTISSPSSTITEEGTEATETAATADAITATASCISSEYVRNDGNTNDIQNCTTDTGFMTSMRDSSSSSNSSCCQTEDTNNRLDNEKTWKHHQRLDHAIRAASSHSSAATDAAAPAANGKDYCPTRSANNHNQTNSATTNIDQNSSTTSGNRSQYQQQHNLNNSVPQEENQPIITSGKEVDNDDDDDPSIEEVNHEQKDEFDYHLNIAGPIVAGADAGTDTCTSLANRLSGNSHTTDSATGHNISQTIPTNTAETETALDATSGTVVTKEVASDLSQTKTRPVFTSSLSSMSGGSSFYTPRRVEDRIGQGARAMMQRRFDDYSSFGSYDKCFPRDQGTSGSWRTIRSNSITSRCSSSSNSPLGSSSTRRMLVGVPRFEREELVLGKRLGKGSFSNVDAIRGITIDKRKSVPTNASTSPSMAMSSTTSLSALPAPPFSAPPSFPKPLKMANGNKMLRREDTIAFNDHESRQFIARHCFRNNGEARYVLKSVRRDVLFNSMGDDTISMLGLCDLAVETMFLSSIVHPNIIKLRAISTADPCSGQYFLVLDRLQETLQQRMETKWVKRERQLYSAVGRYVRDRSGRKRLDFFEHRLERAFDLSSAIEHLHSHKIVHRDIKPDNIGFDVRDDIKLFDFGMARELRDDYKTKDGNYRLSKCGSPRYMAPEVFWGQPYNSMADVYSFAVVLYEMIALNRAFNFVSDEVKNAKKRAKNADEDPAKIEEKFIRLVFKEHKRPDLSRLRAPPSIKELLPMCWSSNPEYRCDMALTNSTLRKELILLSKGDESRLPDFTKRRSTYIFGDSGPFKKSNRSGSSSRSLSKSVDSILRSKGSKHGLDMFDVSFGSLDASMYSFRTTENEK